MGVLGDGKERRGKREGVEGGEDLGEGEERREEGENKWRGMVFLMEEE